MTFKADVAITGRDFFFNPAGSNSNGGFSDEIPVADPQTAIASVNALTIPPGGSNPASINASVTGAYDTGILIPGFTTANCSSASIRSADAILVEYGGNHTGRWGSLFGLSDFATCVKIDGKIRVRAVITACIVPEDGIGLLVSGTCDETFIELIEGVMLGARATMIKHTATSPTPILYTVGDGVFSNTDQLFMEYDPGGASSETVVDVSTAQEATNPVPTSTASSMMFLSKSGTLVVHAQVLVAACIATVESGALIVLDAQAIFGDTFVEAGGIAVYKSVGTIFGNIEAQGVDAVTEIQTETMTGDMTISTGGIATLKTDILTGDISVAAGGRLFCIIDIHNGTVTPSDPSDGRINGIISGIRYGNWQNRREMEVILSGISLLTQNPTGLDLPLQIEFGAAQGGPSDPVEIDALGKITINETGQYEMAFTVQYGRVGAGMASWLFFYVEVNGTQVGDSALTKLDNANSDLPMQMTGTFDLTATDEMKVFVVRDSQGFNSGGLFSETPVTAINDSPSAKIKIERSILE